jgi:hypothetical protein
MAQEAAQALLVALAHRLTQLGRDRRGLHERRESAEEKPNKQNVTAHAPACPWRAAATAWGTTSASSSASPRIFLSVSFPFSQHFGNCSQHTAIDLISWDSSAGGRGPASRAPGRAIETAIATARAIATETFLSSSLPASATWPSRETWTWPSREISPFWRSWRERPSDAGCWSWRPWPPAPPPWPRPPRAQASERHT